MNSRDNLLQELSDEQRNSHAKSSHSSRMLSEFRKEDIEQSLPARFEEIVRLYPDRLAVKAGDRSFSYQAVNHAANCLAFAILAQCGEKGEPIGLILEQGVDVIVAILAVLKAGKIYVPLDPLFPQLRNKDVLQDSAPRLVIANNRTLSLAQELTDSTTSLLNIDDLDLSRSCTSPLVQTTADTLAYILYTSGSTGKPKGVVQNHRNVLHLVMRHTNRMHVTLADRIALLRSFNVHGGTLLTFTALLNGAAIFPFDTKREGVQQLAHWLAREEITLCRMGPSLLRHFLVILRSDDWYPKVREISFSGEPLYWTDVEQARKHFSNNCVLVNSFGSTEVSSCCEFIIATDSPIENGVVPCGYPTSDMEILLLQEDGRETPVGDIGEIAVRSRFLALGYWRNPELTHAKFLPSTTGKEERLYLTGDQGRRLPDGRFVHLGRKDFQVKIRGYRVELSEIESTLLTAENVKEAVVIGQEEPNSEKYLVAYVVPERQPPPNITSLRRVLQNRLPDYMLPSAFVFLDKLPLTSNGKIDRRALPVPERTRPEIAQSFVAPRTLEEKIIAGIWTQVLGLDQVGIHDNFFDLGGHSLKATQVISRMRPAFHVELPLRALFETPTVAGLVESIAQSQEQSGAQTEIARLIAEVEILSEDEAQREFSRLQHETIH